VAPSSGRRNEQIVRGGRWSGAEAEWGMLFPRKVVWGGGGSRRRVGRCTSRRPAGTRATSAMPVQVRSRLQAEAQVKSSERLPLSICAWNGM